MDTVLQPVFYELISKTVQQLHISRDKEGFLDLLLNLFRTIQVSSLASNICMCQLCSLTVPTWCFHHQEVGPEHRMHLWRLVCLIVHA